MILLAGLQGSGKTTTSAKLALLLRKEGKKPALVAADLQRPAAIDQLEQLGRQIQIPVYRKDTQDPVEVVKYGIQAAQTAGHDVVIVDTAGRLHIDEALMDELARVRDASKPTNVLLVLDAMTGQEAVNVAQSFQERVAFDGVILTKLDGDARGGAALSVTPVTGKPIKFVSVGEKLDQLEEFHPDRMASRILGMGDVLTLIEKAEAAVEEDEQAAMEARMRAGKFTFDDFLAAQKMLKKMGPLQGVLKMIPGLGNQLKDVDIDERQLARVEAIVLSMTPQERGMPHLIDGSRRQRIAEGSGQTIQDVNKLLSARKQMEKMMKQMGKGKMPTLPGQLTTKHRTEIEAHGSTHEADASRLEEESDLPRRRRRLALAARRPVHRDRRPLQPADRPVDDRARRGEGQGMARQGRAALRRGREADQGRRHQPPDGRAARLAGQQLVDDPDAVRVEQVERDDVTVLELYVAPEDAAR